MSTVSEIPKPFQHEYWHHPAPPMRRHSPHLLLLLLLLPLLAACTHVYTLTQIGISIHA